MAAEDTQMTPAQELRRDRDPETEEYTVMIDGVETTLQLNKADAERLGARTNQVEVKGKRASAPANKARSSQGNK